MSARCTGWVLDHGPRPDGSITPANARRWRAVLHVIADAANMEGRNSHPGLDNIVAGSLYGRSAVLATLDELQAAGWITMVAHSAPGRATVYDVEMGRDPALLTAQQVQDLDPSQVQDLDPNRSKDGAQQVQISGEQVQISPVAPITTSGVVPRGTSAPAVGRARDEVWDALMAACRIDTTAIPGPARGAYNRAVRELRSIDATPEQIAAKAAAFRRTWPTVSMTPTALVRRWGEVNGGPQVSSSTAALARFAQAEAG